MHELIIARHAESVQTERRVVNGDPAVPDELTPVGVEQALLRLGPVVAEHPPDVCITSRFFRTRLTALVALASNDVRMESDPELDDLDFGEMEGGSLREYRHWFTTHGPDAVVPGAAESRRMTLKRCHRALERIAARPERTILVVAHGLAVTYLIRAYNQQSLDGSVQPADHAEPHLFDRESLRLALTRLGSWTSSSEIAS